MHRVALFVDVGYLVAASGRLLVGSRAAASVECDFAGLAESLEAFAADDCGLPILRSYWYDASRGADARQGLRGLGPRQRSKVRLGSLGADGQKEVDIMLHDELVELAEGGLVACIYLLTGDADFRPTVTRAQRRGVELTIVEIPSQPAAPALIDTADRRVVLAPDQLRPYFKRRPATNKGGASTEVAGATPDTYELSAEQAGAEYAQSWMIHAEPEEVHRLRRQGHWTLPSQVDADLLRYVDRTTGLLAGRPDLRQKARAGFWTMLATTEAMP
ncbi:MAG: NYN domain-containing protein [Candidatus Dormibacteria bacterium]